MEIVRAGTHALDPEVTELAKKLLALHLTLSQLKSEHNRLRQEHSRKCSASLSQALSALLKLVNRVAKTDRKLVYWYEKGDGLTTMLRCVGMDKRTSTIVGKRTNLLRKDVSKVERQFKTTSSVVGDGLEAVEQLNTQVTVYSLEQLGEVQSGSVDLKGTYTTRLEDLERDMSSTKARCETVEKSIESTSTTIDSTSARQRQAAKIGDNCSTHALASWGAGGLLFLGGLAYPPLMVASVAANIYSGGNTIIGIAMDVQANSLARRGNNLHEQLGTLKEEMKTLDEKMPDLKKSQLHVQETVDAISSLQEECTSLRRQSLRLAEELTEAHRILSQIQLHLDRVSSQLMACEYKTTRRSIAYQLRAISVEMEKDQISASVDLVQMRLVTDNLEMIDANTPTILTILGRR